MHDESPRRWHLTNLTLDQYFLCSCSCFLCCFEHFFVVDSGSTWHPLIKHIAPALALLTLNDNWRLSFLCRCICVQKKPALVLYWEVFAEHMYYQKSVTPVLMLSRERLKPLTYIVSGNRSQPSVSSYWVRTGKIGNGQWLSWGFWVYAFTKMMELNQKLTI